MGVGKKREGNLALSSDSSKFRTMSVLSHWLLNVLYPGNVRRIHFQVSRLFQLCRGCCPLSTDSNHQQPPNISSYFPRIACKKDRKSKNLVISRLEGEHGITQGTHRCSWNGLAVPSAVQLAPHIQAFIIRRRGSGTLSRPEALVFPLPLNRLWH